MAKSWRAKWEARVTRPTLSGESVNLASRLTDHARSGEVLLPSAIYRELRKRLDCEDVGDIEVKGLASPVRAWRLHDSGLVLDVGAGTGRDAVRAVIRSIVQAGDAEPSECRARPYRCAGRRGYQNQSFADRDRGHALPRRAGSRPLQRR